jgi:hypothetical protein
MKKKQVRMKYRVKENTKITRWGRDFPHPSRLSLWPTQPPTLWVLGPFPVDKAAETWR